VKIKNEKYHNTFVHIDDFRRELYNYTFTCKHQRYTVLTSRMQTEAKINYDSRNFDVF